MVGNNFAFKLYCFSNKSMFFLQKIQSITELIEHIYQRIEGKVLR